MNIEAFEANFKKNMNIIESIINIYFEERDGESCQGLIEGFIAGALVVQWMMINLMKNEVQKKVKNEISSEIDWIFEMGEPFWG